MQERIKPHKLVDILKESDLWIKNLKNTERIMDFCSAIFAFSVTLLIIQIDVPIEWTEESLQDEFRTIWPGVLGYLICFYVIIKFWMSHLHMFSYIKIINRNFLILICIFLLTITFLPFPSDIFSTHFSKITTTIIFAISIALVSLMSFLVWIYLYFHKEMYYENIDKNVILYNSVLNLNIALGFGLSAIFLFFSNNVNLFWVVCIGAIILLNIIVKQIAKTSCKNKL
ncbi:MAG: TMEM175 family protein [Patescibacteria group bacterium]|nr:TMEM175 family protein [Patescibacteria group bacterium]